MTLIFGINLSDKIYLSGDTRMSRKDDNGVLVDRKDQIIKIVYLTPLIIGSFAADAHMSVFVAKKLKNLLGKNFDIRSFYDQAEYIITPIANEYWETVNPKASLTIIFGGLNPNSKKKFDWENVHKKVLAYTELRKDRPAMNLKPALFNCMLEQQGEPMNYPEPSDSLVFSVQIFPPNGFIKEKAEWGEYLAYGPKGLNKNDIDPLVFGMAEFDSGEESKDNMSISAVLSSIVEQRKEEAVSTTFFNAFISDEAQGTITGAIHRVNLENMRSELIQHIRKIGDKFYSSDEKGTLKKLTFLEDYKDFGNLDIL